MAAVAHPAIAQILRVDRVRRFDPDGCTLGATRDGTGVRRCAARTLSACSVFPSRTFTYAYRPFRSSNQVLVTYPIGLSLDVLHIDGEAKTDRTCRAGHRGK